MGAKEQQTMAGENMYHVILKGQGKLWPMRRWDGLPTHSYLTAVSGEVSTGPAEGLVEIVGEGQITSRFDWGEYEWMTFRRQRAVRQALEAKNWPLIETPTLLSLAFPRWFKPTRTIADTVSCREEVKAVFPLTDLEIVWL